jgi:hypothetical protein
MFKKIMIAWGICLLVATWMIVVLPTLSVPPVPPAPPAPQRMLSSFESCQITLGVFGDISTKQKLEICSLPPESQLDAWLTRNRDDPTYRAVRDGVRDALRR